MDPTAQRYASPVSERVPSPEFDGVRPFWVGLRLHLAAVLVATGLGLATAAVLQGELFDPQGTLPAETYEHIFRLHGTMWWAAALPLSMGVLSAAALPRALGIPAMRGWWLVPASLAVWPLGPLVLLTRTEPIGALTPSVLAFGLLTTGLAMLAAQVLTTLFLHRDRVPEARFLALGLGGAAALQLFAFVASLAQLGGPMLGISSLGTNLVRHPELAIPIAMGVAVHTLQRHGKRAPPAPSLLALSMLAPALAPWFASTGAWAEPLAAVSIVSVAVFSIILSIHYSRSPPRLHPRAALSMAIVALVSASALVDAFLLAISVQVHVHDTYFVLAPIHFRWLSLVLALLLVASEGPDLLGDRSPGRLRLQVGGLLCVVGLGGAFSMMVFLGYSGMPRRYWSYAPVFANSFRWMAACSALGLAGACIVVAAFLRSRDPSSGRTAG